MDKIGIFCTSSNNLDVIYYEEAARFGKWLGENGKTLVYGGANDVLKRKGVVNKPMEELFSIANSFEEVTELIK